ncbi:hypothetical protein DSCA_56870 [Desulfosarcina alkanivorans]|uniref:Uncharacterized protein n=1 Tax=Desulfosarcina alkanivorans TaxID=571177 RepID=A0A5K7Z570_9BACT|nr:hypothetical protein DSCA_56870 [Desulfosarcina alkanivorans]
MIGRYIERFEIQIVIIKIHGREHLDTNGKKKFWIKGHFDMAHSHKRLKVVMAFKKQARPINKSFP